MSLHNKFVLIDLAPDVPPQPLSLVRARDYWTLFLWLLYNPQALFAYVERFLVNPPPPTAALSVVARLHLQTGLLTLFVYGVGVALSTALAGMTQWLTPNQLLLSMVGAAVVGLGMIVVIIGFGWFWGYPAEAAIFSFLSGFGAIVIYWYLTHPDSTIQPASTLVGYWLSFNFLSGTFAGLVANQVIGWIRRHALHGAAEIAFSGSVFVGLMIASAMVVGNFYRDFSINAPLFELSALPSLYTLLNLFSALLAYVIASLRPIDWLCHMLYPLFIEGPPPGVAKPVYIPRVTWIAPESLRLLFASWLKQDWERAITNFDQIWKYTNLRRSVVKTIRQELGTLQENATEKMVALIDPNKGYGWTVDDLFAEELFWPSLRRGSFSSWWQQLRQSFSLSVTLPDTNRTIKRATAWHGGELPMRNSAEASLAALLYLQRFNVPKAIEGFKSVTKSPLATEMTQLSETLKTLSVPDRLIEKATEFKLPAKPEEPARPETWEALAEFRNILVESWLYSRCNKHSVNRDLLHNSVVTRLQKLHTKPWLFPEEALIHEIAQRWEPQLAAWFNPNEPPQRPKEFEDNPFEPDESLKKGDKLFQKRKKQQALLQGAYMRNMTLLIYGQPFTGKTSLLNNIDNKGLRIRPPIHISLEALSHPTLPVSLQLLRILGQRLQLTSGLTPPTDTSNVTNYYAEFNNYLYQVCDLMMPHHLIIQIDHLEHARLLTTLHSQRNQSASGALLTLNSSRSADLAELFTFLSNLPINLKNLTVMFIGRVTPAEFDDLAHNPAHVTIPSVHVTFLEKTAIASLLNGPLASAIARFDQSGIDAVYALTNGHPMLTQLIAAMVIDQFNEILEKKTRHPDPIFSVSDIYTLLNMNPMGDVLAPTVVTTFPFWKQCSEYFEACIRQAAQRFPEGAAILWTIAKQKDGISLGDLAQSSFPIPINIGSLEMILEELGEQDQVCTEDNGQVRLSVELLRIYLFHVPYTTVQKLLTP